MPDPRGIGRDVTANDGRSGDSLAGVKKPVRRNFVIICPGAVIFWSNHVFASQQDK
jgi:hypothetical protein